MDYEVLLQKYMAHIIECERSDYVHKIHGCNGQTVKFTEDERAELQHISDYKADRYMDQE